MDLTNPQRLVKLTATLVRHPHDFPAYCRYHYFRGRRPVDLGLPWWSFAAIEAVKEFCSGAEEVFEYGSGGSTMYLAGICQSVEDDAGWCDRMRKEIEHRALDNIEQRLCPFDFQKSSGFDTSDYLCASAGTEYDLIVVDDSWRYPQLRASNRARTVKTFEGVGPYRVGVTSTDLYYY